MAKPLEIEIYSPELEQALRKLPLFSLAIQNELGPATIDILAYGQRHVARYPPAAPTSTYIRTGLLGKSWSIDVRPVSHGVRGILGNPTEYAAHVQFEGQQAQVHMGRWPTVQQLSRGPLLQFAINRFKSAIDRTIWKFFGLFG